MDVKRDATASVTLGSLQDNGSAQTTGIPLWTSRTGGDGFDVVFDHVTVTDAFEIHNVSATTDGIFMSNDSGTTFAAVAGDWLVPPDDIAALARQIDAPASFHEIESIFGHDAFLKETGAVADVLRSAFAQIAGAEVAA